MGEVAAEQFLASLPEVQTLMPALNVEEVKKLTAKTRVEDPGRHERAVLAARL